MTQSTKLTGKEYLLWEVSEQERGTIRVVDLFLNLVAAVATTINNGMGQTVTLTPAMLDKGVREFVRSTAPDGYAADQWHPRGRHLCEAVELYREYSGEDTWVITPEEDFVGRDTILARARLTNVRDRSNYQRLVEITRGILEGIGPL